MSRRIAWRHFTSALVAPCIALLVALGGARAAPFTPPDPVTYGARLEAGDLAQARAWLAAGLDPEYIAEHIGTGLMIGAWTGNLELMKLYLERGADVDKSNSLGEQALMHAAFRGNLAAVDLLLASGARVNNEPLRWSALHYAAFAGHQEVAVRLIRHGANIDAGSTNGSSPLMMAVYEGHEALVKELLLRGADPRVKNDRGDGALEWAFKFKRLGIARLVASETQFAAAANRPAAAWGAPVRSAAAPAPAPAAAERPRDETAAREPPPSEIDELLRARAILAERGLARSVQALDGRIAALRAQRARADMDFPATVLLEITARRAAPEDQTTRFVIDASAPLP